MYTAQKQSNKAHFIYAKIHGKRSDKKFKRWILNAGLTLWNVRDSRWIP